MDIDDLLAVINNWGACASCSEDEIQFDGMSTTGGDGSDPPDIDWEYFANCLTNGSAEQQAACLAQLESLLQH